MFYIRHAGPFVHVHKIRPMTNTKCANTQTLFHYYPTKEESSLVDKQPRTMKHSARTTLVLFSLIVTILVNEIWTNPRDSVVIKDDCAFSAQTESSSSKLPLSSSSQLPNRLTFNYHTNLLQNVSSLKGKNRILALNLNHTIHAFREAWNESDVMVAFLTDEDCHDTIEMVEPRLLSAFHNETNGSHKSDICRIMDLYLYGGYYLDNDLFVVNVPQFPNHVTFSSVLELKHLRFFQAFTASSPGHPIFKETIDLMVEYYVDGLNPRSLGQKNNNMGTWTLREGQKRAVAKHPKLAMDIWMLHEVNLEDFPNEWFSEHFRDKNWRMYNFCVADMMSDKLIFRSRVGKDLVTEMGW